MAKLVATYAEGFFAVFTEDRSGMRQRALIDIGDNTPTPNDMAKLAGQLSDQWGWQNAIEKVKVPTATPLPSTEKRPYASSRQTGEPVGDIRNAMILEFLADHPKSTTREILTGLGFEDSDARLARWHHAFSALVKAGQIIAETIRRKNEKGINYRANIYSLASGDE